MLWVRSLQPKRQKEILKLLHDNGSVKIGQLADYFEVSRETIRRDLSYLTEIGAAQRSHGRGYFHL